MSRYVLPPTVRRMEDSVSDTSVVPGYTLSALRETRRGLTAELNLAGPACNAFGRDVTNLTLEVTYDTESRSVRLCPLPASLSDSIPNSDFT